MKVEVPDEILQDDEVEKINQEVNNFRYLEIISSIVLHVT